MSPANVSIVVAACLAAVAAQPAPQEPPRFRVGVDLVSIDAVVTDSRGEVVRGLTAADFEIFQDGKRQEVRFAQFVRVITSAVSAADASRPSPAAPGTSGDLAAPPIPAAPITREAVARTIVILVDDLGLSVEGMHNIRRGLRQFVEKGLLPTDLVAVVRTGASEGVFRPFTNDREVLRAAIDGLRYNGASRKTVSPLTDVISGLHGSEIEEPPGNAGLATAGSLAALNLVVETARDVPGRKTVIFASEGFDPNDPQVFPGLGRAIDQATRSGVVVYAVDGQALQTGTLRAADDVREPTAFDPRATSRTESGHGLSGATLALASARRSAMRQAQETLQHLTEPTGGFAVMNTNDLGAGLVRISDDVRDYYVIAYEPDERTFAAGRQTPQLHQITVKVKRAGARVRTRKEFVGVSDPEVAPTQTPAQMLGRAAMSPFGSAAIPVRAAHQSGYVPGRGLFVRTIMHVDARALSFGSDGGEQTASAHLVGLVYSSDGVQVAALSTQFDVRFDDAAAEQAIKDGIVYTARVWLGGPGGYQVRYALRDRRSGAVGSAGGFVDVPDVARGAFALSGLILQTREGAASEPKDGGEIALRPADALRVFAPGTELRYSYEIYNRSPRPPPIRSSRRRLAARRST